jgi:hypothetical protein
MATIGPDTPRPGPPASPTPAPGRRRSRGALRAAQAALAAAAAIAGACVTVRQTPTTGLTRAPVGASAIARPISPRARTDSSVSVAVRPLGSVPFDAMTLPLVSPDGRYVAVQHGPTPPWPTLLAEPGALPPPALSIDVYDLDALRATLGPAGATADLRPIDPPHRLPPGALLGRSCDDRGFLIEQPRRDGSRRLGLVSWGTGDTAWITAETDAATNAFATLGHHAEVAFSRRDPGSPRFSLVVRSPGVPGEAIVDAASAERTLSSPAGSYLCPLFGLDPDTLFALYLPDRAGEPLAIVAVPLDGGSPSLAVRFSAPLGPVPGLLAALQCVAPLQTPWPPQPGAPAALADGVALVSPATGSMLWFDARTGALVPLAPGTAGAAPLIARGGGGGEAGGAAPGGLFLGTARSLIFQNLAFDSRNGLPSPGPEAEVLAGPLIPRGLTPGPGGPQYLLLGVPSLDSEPRIGLIEMAPSIRP